MTAQENRDLRARTEAELNADLESAHQALFNLRFQSATRQLADVSQVRKFNDLPANAQRYVLRLEEWIGVPITWISIGPKRDQVIVK